MFLTCYRIGVCVTISQSDIFDRVTFVNIAGIALHLYGYICNEKLLYYSKLDQNNDLSIIGGV